MQISRMDLADVGDNPKRLAAALIDQTGLTSGKVPIRDIAMACDIFEIKEEPLANFEGALVTTEEKDIGSMIVHRDRPEKRKRFSIGHELGHFLIGYHKPVGAQFECSARDMTTEWFGPTDRAAKMEVEANVFAAEMLMPKKFLTPWMSKRREVDVSHVVDLSEQFEVSREAAARRYRDYANEPVAFVFSKDGRVRYSIRHEDFPRLDIGKNDQVPLESITARFGKAPGSTSALGAVDRGLWIADTRRGEVCEQVLVQRNGYRLTLLALTGDEDDVEADWDSPRFRR